MNKVLKIVLIVIACIVALILLAGIIAYVATGNTADAKEYKLGNDTIKSVKTVVGKRQVASVSTNVKDGITTKEIEYESDSVQEDLLEYTQYLRNEGDFTLTKDMDLEEIPSVVELAKTSKDSGKVIIMTIDYNSYGYTITIQKGEGTFNMY